VKVLAEDVNDICVKLRSLLGDAVKRNLAEGILFSGGLDTSVVAAVASQLVSLKAFTVALQGAHAPDVESATLVSKILRLKHFVYYFDESQMFETIPIVVKTLKTFDPMQISGSIGILIGLELAKDNGTDAVMTGDGCDELFAGYSSLFKLKKDELDRELRRWWSTMRFESVPLGNAVGVEVKLPLLDPEFKAFAMKLDSRYKIRVEDGQKRGKWIMRKAFEDMLTKEVAWRAKIPGAIGMGLWESLPKIFNSRISDEEFEEKKRNYLERDRVTIQDKQRLFYYEIFRSAVGVPRSTDPNAKTCPYCNSDVLPASSSFCRTCGAYPI
jgi:asparagine synthase (glutamine-hydrolysing)